MFVYQVSNQVILNVSPEDAFDFASNPLNVPKYEDGIKEIKIENRISETEYLGRTRMRIGLLSFSFPFRYRYSRPGVYSGEQQGGILFSAFFVLTFSASLEGTVVRHTEGVKSSIPFLPQIVGMAFLSKKKIQSELEKLKSLLSIKTLHS